MNQGEYESDNELGNCKCIFNNFPCTKCNNIYSKKNKKVCTECNVDLDDNCNEFNSLCKEMLFERIQQSRRTSASPQ